MHFLRDDSCILIQISVKFVPRSAINNKGIGSDNSMTPNRRQANIRTNDGVVKWRIYVSFGLSNLITFNTIIFSDLQRL